MVYDTDAGDATVCCPFYGDCVRLLTPQNALPIASLDAEDDEPTGAEDDASSTTSMDSMAAKFPLENDRTYHAFEAGSTSCAVPLLASANVSAEYCFPNDQVRRRTGPSHFLPVDSLKCERERLGTP